MREPGQQPGPVPDLAGLLTARDARQHRAEESHAVDVEHGRADVHADRVHAAVVADAQRLVQRRVGGRVGERGGQTGLLERGDEQRRVGQRQLVGRVDRMQAPPQGGVERQQAVDLLLCRDAHAHRSPAVRHQLLVVRRQIASLVQDGQAHDVPGDRQRPHLLDLQHPARGDPRPGAQRVEPEVELGGGVRGRHPCMLPPRFGTALVERVVTDSSDCSGEERHHT